MPCRYLWKTDYEHWVCSQSGIFAVLDLPPGKAPDTCSECQECRLKDSSPPSTKERLAFAVWHKEAINIVSLGEKAAEMMVDLDELNALQLEGDEAGVAAMREEMLVKYRDYDWLDIYLNDDIWAVKLRPLPGLEDSDGSMESGDDTMDQLAAPRERYLVLYSDGGMDCGWIWRPTEATMRAAVEELRADGTYSDVSALEFAGMDEPDHEGIEVSSVPFLLLFQGRDHAGWSYCSSADRVSSQIREINTCGDMEIEVYQIERMRAVDLN